VVRAPLTIALSTLALAGIAVGTAKADTVIDVPGVADVTVPVPAVTVDTPGHAPVDVQVPGAEVTLPRGGSRPPVTVGPESVGPVTTPPVSTPPLPTPDPPLSTPPVPAPLAQPTTAAQPTTPAADTTTTTKTATRPASTHAPAAQAAPAVQRHAVAPVERSSNAPAQSPTRRRSAAPTSAPTAAARRPTTHPPDPVPTKQRTATRPRKAGTIQATIREVAERLPGWVVAAFLGFAALAAGMAVNAYASSRRARRLSAQREELVHDVGQLQAALLAPVPAAPDEVSFSVAYRPAAGLAAGGDFYDVFELDSTRTAMLLGDVSGHGRESVAHAALVRYTLRTFIAAGHGPARAIELTDPCVDGHMDGQFATVVAAIYDHDAQTLTYARAGHHPPLVLGVDDAPVASTTPPIGAGLGPTPRDVTLDVAPGATVCFFTDGLVEARDRGTPLGTERVELLLARAPADAEALIAAVAAEADELSDDLAVCLLHRPADAPDHFAELVGSRCVS
jgi:Stage II sporulation protein E (SpoIIE)